MVVGFTIAYAISAYHHKCCEFESHSGGVLDIALCDKVCTPVSSTNKTDRHNIAEILLKVALNTISLTLIQSAGVSYFIVKFN